MHFPLLWRFRLLRAIHAQGSWQNRKLLAAWAKAEGGNAKYNPLNTTQPWPGTTPYNSFGPNGQYHVWNYPSGAAGVSATAATLVNGRFNGILADLRAGKKSAKQLVSDNAAQFDAWGTGAGHILALL